MNKKLQTTQLLILFLTSTIIFAQTIKEKIKNIEGEATKIMITTNKGDVTFVGDEAKELLEMIRDKKHKKIKWISESDIDFDFDSEGDNVFILKSDGNDKHIIREFIDGDDLTILTTIDEEIDLINGNRIMKVEVNDEDGDKTVTVTTTEDGEKKIETFKGKEADEYLDDLKEEHEIIVDVDIDKDSKHVWIHNEEEGHNIEKKVKVELNDGVKKVTVTTTKDGKETVEVFEGDDADEYLESKDGSKTKVKVKKLKDGKTKKIIIKEIKKEEE